MTFTRISNLTLCRWIPASLTWKTVIPRDVKKTELSSFCYYIKYFYEKVYKSKKVSYTGKDASQKFPEMLLEDITDIANIPNMEMVFGEEEKYLYNRASKCWICGEGGFTAINFKVRDHCHFTGRFRGAAHNLCNLKYRRPKFTPVLSHNLIYLSKILVGLKEILIAFLTLMKSILV